VLYRLCLAGLAPHPRFLKRVLNSRDIADWIAYSRVEPFGPMHDELIGGVIAAEVFNNGSHPDGTQAIAPVDRMPSFEPPEMSADEIMRVVRGCRQ
jgi:hypothetical protein